MIKRVVTLAVLLFMDSSHTLSWISHFLSQTLFNLCVIIIRRAESCLLAHGPPIMRMTLFGSRPIMFFNIVLQTLELKWLTEYVSNENLFHVIVTKYDLSMSVDHTMWWLQRNIIVQEFVKTINLKYC